MKPLQDFQCKGMDELEYQKFEDEFKEMDQIGEGAYGLIRGTKEIVIKRISPINDLINEFNSEIRTMLAFKDSLEFVKLYDGKEDSRFSDIQCFYPKNQGIYVAYLVLPRYFTSLYHYISTAKICKSKIWKIDTMIKLAIGLKKFHDNGFMHCDIKPENIFMLDQFTPIYGDMGEAMTDYEKKNHKTGTDEYLAPEIYNEQEKFIYTKKVDVFALGVLFVDITLNQFSTQHFRPENEKFKFQNIGKHYELDEKNEDFYKIMEPLILEMTSDIYSFRPNMDKVIEFLFKVLKDYIDQDIKEQKINYKSYGQYLSIMKQFYQSDKTYNKYLQKMKNKLYIQMEKLIKIETAYLKTSKLNLHDSFFSLPQMVPTVAKDIKNDELQFLNLEDFKSNKIQFLKPRAIKNQQSQQFKKKKKSKVIDNQIEASKALINEEQNLNVKEAVLQNQDIDPQKLAAENSDKLEKEALKKKEIYDQIQQCKNLENNLIKEIHEQEEKVSQRSSTDSQEYERQIDSISQRKTLLDLVQQEEEYLTNLTKYEYEEVQNMLHQAKKRIEQMESMLTDLFEFEQKIEQEEQTGEPFQEKEKNQEPIKENIDRTSFEKIFLDQKSFVSPSQNHLANNRYHYSYNHSTPKNQHEQKRYSVPKIPSQSLFKENPISFSIEGSTGKSSNQSTNDQTDSSTLTLESKKSSSNPIETKIPDSDAKLKTNSSNQQIEIKQNQLEDQDISQQTKKKKQEKIENQNKEIESRLMKNKIYNLFFPNQTVSTFDKLIKPQKQQNKFISNLRIQRQNSAQNPKTHRFFLI